MFSIRRRHTRCALVSGVQTCALPISVREAGMKLHFEPDLDYQHTAIEAVCDLFRGQEINRTEFTVTRRPRPLRDSTGQAGLDLGAFTGVQGELGIVENELKSEENTSELQSLMRISYDVLCLKKN